MQPKSLIALALAASFAGLAGTAFADDKTDAERRQQQQIGAPSQVDRAAVVAELLRAREAGIAIGHGEYSAPMAGPASADLHRDRSEVRAEARAATLDRLDGSTEATW